MRTLDRRNLPPRPLRRLAPKYRRPTRLPRRVIITAFDPHATRVTPKRIPTNASSKPSARSESRAPPSSLVEQNAFAALKLAQNGCVLSTGKTFLRGRCADLLQNTDRAYLSG